MNTSDLLSDSSAFVRHATTVLHDLYDAESDMADCSSNPSNVASSVLLLIGPRQNGSQPPGPCLILNKRSARVRQPGDLCCPGGGIYPIIDTWISRILTLPFSPLTRWPYWKQFRHRRPLAARSLACLYATGLRESFEEMRLNPLGVRLLGPLPPRRLESFDRIIHPTVAWVPRQKRFFPNWEVDKIVSIPIRSLISRHSYARYRLDFPRDVGMRLHGGTMDFPCFVHGNSMGREVLWGATYKIIMEFLERVFEFTPPQMDTLPVIHGILDANYLTGS